MEAAIALYLLCRVLDAYRDTHAHHHSISIFAGWKHKWFVFDAWRNKYKNRDPKQGRTWVPVQFTCAWHFSKMVEIFIYTWLAVYPYFNGWAFWLVYGGAGIAGNLLFSLFYDKLFIKKKV